MARAKTGGYMQRGVDLDAVSDHEDGRKSDQGWARPLPLRRPLLLRRTRP
jgi:hypothetical protein